MVLKRPFVNDIGEAKVHPFRSSSRNTICWDAELYEPVELYLKDVMKRLFFGDPLKQICMVIIRYHGRWSSSNLYDYFT